MENSKKKGGIIAIIIAIILAIGGLIGWLVYDKSAGKPKTDEEIATELLAEIKGYTYTVGADRKSERLENGWDYYFSIDGYAMDENDFLTINADGTCTVRCFTRGTREFTGTFTIGEFIRSEVIEAGRTMYYFEIIDNTTSFVTFELDKRWKTIYLSDEI